MGPIAVAVACALALACTGAQANPPPLSAIEKPRAPPLRLRHPAHPARISDAVAVEGCDYLGDFVGTGGSRRSLLQWNAAEAAATDVVFSTNASSVRVAKGYWCPSSAHGRRDARDADIAE